MVQAKVSKMVLARIFCHGKCSFSYCFSGNGDGFIIVLLRFLTSLAIFVVSVGSMLVLFSALKDNW